MPLFKDWLAQKFNDWEKTQGRKQSYYAFARYLGVSQANLAQWMEGAALPSGDDLRTLAELLGAEVYDLLQMDRPDPQLERLLGGFPALPSSLRERLSVAIWEASQYLKKHGLSAESVEAKKAILEIFARFGIRLTN
ncbi:predicted transcriptional regulator [Anaerolinea thermolimosa]|nr:helix-turn-helix transcriptional regulator [Anaerolinea thermolimosa]GAP08039.1 predicted transcriptional regulator [Anaerolinea thermolimosa]